MVHDVFISYSNLDKNIADAICSSLEVKKIRCWIAPRDILSGQSWPEAIANAIPKSKVMVLIYSANSVNSQEVLKELTIAMSSGVKVIPFRIEQVPLQGSWKYHLINTHWLDAINPPTELQIKDLIYSVSILLSVNISKSDEESRLLVSSAINEIDDDIIAGTIIAEGRRYISKGCNPVLLKQGISKALDSALEAFPGLCRKLIGDEDIRQYAKLVSGDERIGNLFVDAYKIVEDMNAIFVDSSKTTEIFLEVVNGIWFDRGYLSPFMITDDENKVAVLYDPYILITDEKIKIQDIIPVLEKIVEIEKKLVIIAEDFESDVLETLVVNMQNGLFTCVAVRAPEFGERKKENLQDIATITGGKVITKKLGLDIKEVDTEIFGRANYVIVKKESTMIVGGFGNHEEIHARALDIKTQIENTLSEFDKEKFIERLLKFANGIAVIKVGAETYDNSIKRLETIKRTLKELQLAMETGIVPGYGIAYVSLITHVSSLLYTIEGDEKIGVEIFLKAMEMPIRQLAVSNGFEGDVLVKKLLIKTSNNKIDFLREQYIDIFEEGIVEPAGKILDKLKESVSRAIKQRWISI